MVPFRNIVYVEDRDAFLPDDEVPAGSRVLHLSGSELRRRLSEGRDLPPWFTFPEIAAELRRSHPPRAGPAPRRRLAHHRPAAHRPHRPSRPPPPSLAVRVDGGFADRRSRSRVTDVTVLV